MCIRKKKTRPNPRESRGRMWRIFHKRCARMVVDRWCGKMRGLVRMMRCIFRIPEACVYMLVVTTGNEMYVYVREDTWEWVTTRMIEILRTNEWGIVCVSHDSCGWDVCIHEPWHMWMWCIALINEACHVCIRELWHIWIWCIALTNETGMYTWAMTHVNVMYRTN